MISYSAETARAINVWSSDCFGVGRTKPLRRGAGFHVLPWPLRLVATDFGWRVGCGPVVSKLTSFTRRASPSHVSIGGRRPTGWTPSCSSKLLSAGCAGNRIIAVWSRSRALEKRTPSGRGRIGGGAGPKPRRARRCWRQNARYLAVRSPAFVQLVFGNERPAGDPRIGGRHAR